MATVDLTSGHDGRSITMAVGDTAVLRLSDNPSTGYRWEMSPPTGEFLSLEESGYEPNRVGVGGAGVAVWALRAKAAGRTTVCLKRWRPWEGEQSVVSRIQVSVNIV